MFVLGLAQQSIGLLQLSFSQFVLEVSVLVDLLQTLQEDKEVKTQKQQQVCSSSCSSLGSSSCSSSPPPSSHTDSSGSPVYPSGWRFLCTGCRCERCAAQFEPGSLSVCPGNGRWSPSSSPHPQGSAAGSPPARGTKIQVKIWINSGFYLPSACCYIHATDTYISSAGCYEPSSLKTLSRLAGCDVPATCCYLLSVGCFIHSADPYVHITYPHQVVTHT